MSESMSCCRCCTSFIFTLGLTSLFLWLSLRPSSPAFYIQNFYAPALNTTTTATATAAATDTNTINTTIAINFKIENTNKDKRIYYDALNITLYYRPNLSFSVGNALVPGFRQGHQKKAFKQATVQPVEINWEEAVKKVSSNGIVGFRVDLATNVRYKIIVWTTERHKVRVHADVMVDKQGKQIEKKRIKLKSAAPDRCCHRSCFSGVLAFFFVLLTVW
ncbi:protein NDR1-like [Telopea speciosissima]|uniref:protein NDR1-like n=1 Tax=Telopea speciosissima TaxID=54955 RepID=UPI001CC5E555|nr:protein NDR1-like [Telopea speciosissima]